MYTIAQKRCDKSLVYNKKNPIRWRKKKCACMCSLIANDGGWEAAVWVRNIDTGITKKNNAKGTQKKRTKTTTYTREHANWSTNYRHDCCCRYSSLFFFFPFCKCMHIQIPKQERNNVFVPKWNQLEKYVLQSDRDRRMEWKRIAHQMDLFCDAFFTHVHISHMKTVSKNLLQILIRNQK